MERKWIKVLTLSGLILALVACAATEVPKSSYQRPPAYNYGYDQGWRHLLKWDDDVAFVCIYLGRNEAICGQTV